MKHFDSVSPTAFRYVVEELTPYLSEEAYVNYQIKVELALLKALSRYDICPPDIVEEVEGAVGDITAEEVYAEDGRIGHIVRALVNVMRSRVSERARPFIHIPATSNDITDTARALMYRDAVYKVILPDMLGLARAYIDLARMEKDTVQIGRTHGQHAVPITFGFAIANYVDRWGKRIMDVKAATGGLVGNMSGAVGAYNAASLLVENPQQFEADVLAEFGLRPASVSTQIVQPEPLVNLIHSVITSWGVLANFCDDMRNLQRTEIAEVREPSTAGQVGSSTMPHKQNPIGFENVKSLWKEFMPRVQTFYMDQISEHQRDMTNSASQRFTPEIFVAFDYVCRGLKPRVEGLVVDRERMKKNMEINAGTVAAEAIQVLLSKYGYTRAHEEVRLLSRRSKETGKQLPELVFRDYRLQKYVRRFTREEREAVTDPGRHYTGKAPKIAEDVCREWEKALAAIDSELL